MTHFKVTSMYGVVCAAMNFALIMLLYLINMNLLAEWYVGMLAFLIIVVFQFLGTVAARKAHGVPFSFGMAWKESMTVAAVAQIVGVAFTLVLYQVIAPELPGVLEQITLDKSMEMMEGFGMSGDMLELQMREIKKAMSEAYTAKGLLKSSAYAMLMWAIVSLIVAAITRRNQPSEFA